MTRKRTPPATASSRIATSSGSHSSIPSGAASAITSPSRRRNSFDFPDRAGRDAELVIEHAAQLAEHGLAHNQDVFHDDDPEQVRTDPPGRERTDQDVRVEEYPQEMSRKTSSSVRYPRASAKGVIRRRSSASWSIANRRSRASRTMALRLRPLFRAARSRRRSSFRPILMVRVEVFMSYNVVHRPGAQQTGGGAGPGRPQLSGGSDSRWPSAQVPSCRSMSSSVQSKRNGAIVIIPAM